MSFATSIQERALAGGGRLFIAPTKTKDVVSVAGSVYGGTNMLPDAKSEVPYLAAELLDAGTTKRSKEQIRGTLAKLGATLSFTAGGDRMHFAATCFPEDLGIVLGIAFECLSHASFPKGELEAARKRILGELLEERTDSKAQARIALMQTLYDASHPNFVDATSVQEKKIKRVSRSDLVSYGKMLGRGGLVLSVVGDVEPGKAAKVVESASKTLAKGTLTPPPKKPNAKKHKAGLTRIPLKDKANIDAFFGACVPFTYDSPEYLAFMTMASMLGGKGLSTGHLMRTIRERDGYTYGIYAIPGGFEDKLAGHFLIWATFSPDTFEKALAATKMEIGVFLSGGITEKDLARKKTEIIGRYLIGLSTTRGLASALHGIGIEGKPLSYLDEYPDLIKKLSIEDVTAASRRVPLEALAIAAAGSFA